MMLLVSSVAVAAEIHWRVLNAQGALAPGATVTVNGLDQAVQFTVKVNF